jgi:hypothetical protein
VNCDEVRLMQSVSKVAGRFVNLTAVALRDVTVSKRGKGAWSTGNEMYVAVICCF